MKIFSTKYALKATGTITYSNVNYSSGECLAGKLEFDPSKIYIPDESYVLSFKIDMAESCYPSSEGLNQGLYKLFFDFKAYQKEFTPFKTMKYLPLKQWNISL